MVLGKDLFLSDRKEKKILFRPKNVMDQFPEDAGPDLVAVWEVHLADGVHMIEFEHGTTSGKRVIR